MGSWGFNPAVEQMPAVQEEGNLQQDHCTGSTGEVPLRGPLTKRVCKILSPDQHQVDTCGELSMAEVRSIPPQERLDDVL